MVLDPKCEESFPLIARVYPGKSKEDILSSDDACQTQIKLRVRLKHLAAKISDSSSRSANTEATQEEKLPKRALLYLEGINLKVDEDAMVEGNGRAHHSKSDSIKTASASSLTTDHKHELASQAATQSQTDSSSRLEEVEELTDGEALVPRQWSVLHYPLPHFSTNLKSPLCSSQEALKEENIYKTIYYSKKSG